MIATAKMTVPETTGKMIGERIAVGRTNGRSAAASAAQIGGTGRNPSGTGAMTGTGVRTTPPRMMKAFAGCSAPHLTGLIACF
jgi:hypothetical protein